MDIKYKDFSLKNVKTFEGMEGEGFNATLLYNNKEIGLIINEGSGGGTFIRASSENTKVIKEFLTTEEATKLAIDWNDKDSKLFNIKFPVPNSLSEETFYDQLFEDFMLHKEVKKLTKKYGLIFKVNENDNEYRFYKSVKVWTNTLFESLVTSTRAKYPNAVIMNKELDIYPVFK